MRILHISDTHGFHNQFPLSAFDNIDMVIHSGDCSNTPFLNPSIVEIHDFLDWYEKIPVKHKLLVAGNHDAAIARRSITREDMLLRGIIYLENESIEIDGVKFWGSPITPTFGTWYFMKPRDKTHEVWKTIPDDTHVIIVHGPPKGVRDLSYNRERRLEMCGDKALLTRCEELPKLEWVMFGHIHDYKDIYNQGVSIRDGVAYSNGACVHDGRFDLGLTSFGNYITINI